MFLDQLGQVIREMHSRQIADDGSEQSWREELRTRLETIHNDRTTIQPTIQPRFSQPPQPAIEQFIQPAAQSIPTQLNPIQPAAAQPQSTYIAPPLAAVAQEQVTAPSFALATESAPPISGAD